MVIRPSASQEVRRLVAELVAGAATPEVRREAAIARLGVIGTRAVRQLLEAFDTAPPESRVLLLRAMEAIPDPRVTGAVLQGARNPDPAVRAAAARASRGLLVHPESTPLLDCLIGLALDAERQPDDVRLAALEALFTLPSRTIRPVIERLAADPSPAVREAVRRDWLPAEDPVADLDEASDGWLPRDPHAVAHLVARAGAQAPLSTLHRLVEKVRSREGEGRRSRRKEWQAVRGMLHLALARRGSRVALYDLREAMERAEEPLPPDFVEAISLAGDAASLESLAVAFIHAESVPDGDDWRRTLAQAFQGIVARERVTRRQNVIRRLQSRFGPRIAALVAGVPATAPPATANRRAGRRDPAAGPGTRGQHRR